MEIHQNTLYVMTQGAYLHREHLTLQVEVEKETRLSVPIHHIDSVAVFGTVMVSPGAMELCADNGAAVTFLSESGRLLARVDAPQSGNILLRREQFRKADRPGRPSLALDLMEEFRPLIADRVVLALINRKEVRPDGFKKREGGAVEMDAQTRKAVVSAYQQRKQEEVTHPLLDQKVRTGLLPYLQAKLLARHIRGDIPDYPPCVLR